MMFFVYSIPPLDPILNFTKETKYVESNKFRISLVNKFNIARLIPTKVGVELKNVAIDVGALPPTPSCIHKPVRPPYRCNKFKFQF